MDDKSGYSNRLRSFLATLPKMADDQTWRSEFIFEALQDECIFGSLAETLSWYRQQVLENQMTYMVIPLSECRGWSLSAESGSLVHESGEFFRVDGIRVNASPSREVTSGWDQPILTQIGFDGGILGLIRKRFAGIPHYLIEAKAEPGNYNFVQITTTIQATFSNLKRAHKGSGTPYAEYFLNPKVYGASVVFEQWMSEDGGRLLNKRNRTMLIEIPESHEFPLIAPRYRWVSLFQLKSLLKTEDAIVAPHIRGILAVV